VQVHPLHPLATPICKTVYLTRPAKATLSVDYLSKKVSK